MSILSVGFYLFLAGLVFLYYLPFKGLQKYLLCAASLYFYISASAIGGVKTLVIMAFVFILTYFGALIIHRLKGKGKTFVTFLCIAALVGALVLFKYSFNLAANVVWLLHIGADLSFLEFGAIIGFSYYTLSAIGMLLEVSWDLYEPAKNPCDFLLFIFFFPCVISGPILRWQDFSKQINARHEFKLDNLCDGAERILVGAFKKLVISERFKMFTDSVFLNPSGKSFFILLLGTLSYVVQLYTDFSGCLDIVIGAAKLFDISIPENFNTPFKSETFREFWQRWHITLGGWFKDFVMYPVQKSGLCRKIGTSLKKNHKKAARKVPAYIAMFAVWMLLGIWHGGTGYYFFATGLIPFVILVIGDLLEPWHKRIEKENNAWWLKVLKRVRTLLLVSLCWFFICVKNVGLSFEALARGLANPFTNFSADFGSAVSKLGVSDFIIMAAGLVVLYVNDTLKFKAVNEGKFTEGRAYVNASPVIRWIVVYALAMLILFAGLAGQSDFIYFKF